MEIPYSAADLVICRAGATTIAELLFFGLPSVLIPYPYAADKHQNLNADYLFRNGAALMEEEKVLTGENLAKIIKSLMENPERLEKMSAVAKSLSLSDAADRIVNYVLRFSSEKTSA